MVALANKVLASSDAARVHERTGLEVVGEVPLDPAQAQADRQGVALLERLADERAPLVREAIRGAGGITDHEPPG